MRKQHGFGVIEIMVGLAIIAGAVWAWNSYLAGVEQDGYDRGVKETQAAYTKRDNEALAKANARILELIAQKEGLEAKHRLELATLTDNHSKEMKNAKRQKERDVANARAGTLVLRDPGKPAACPPAADRGASATAAASPGGGNGQTGANLSPEASAFLFELAHEADAIVRQLTLCQAVIIKDRATFNAP